MWSVPPRERGMMWSTSMILYGNSVLQPLHRPSCCPKRTCLFLQVVDRRVDVRATWDVGAGGDEPVVEQVAHEVAEAQVHKLDGLRGQVYANPLAAQLLGGYAGRGASGEGVEHHVTGVR